jgi:flagellar motility protein MotE (MotC chaperone)
MTAVPWKVSTAALLVIVLALLVAVVSIASARNEARRARDSAVAAVGVLAGNLATCRGNTATLEAAVRDQGLATRQAAERAETEQAEGQRQLRAVEARNSGLLESVHVLRGLLAREAPKTCQEGWDAFSSAVGR